jgi:hypothetical protein
MDTYVLVIRMLSMDNRIRCERLVLQNDKPNRLMRQCSTMKEYTAFSTRGCVHVCQENLALTIRDCLYMPRKPHQYIPLHLNYQSLDSRSLRTDIRLTLASNKVFWLPTARTFTMQLSKLVTLIHLTALSVRAHPGHDLTEEIMERRSFVNSVRQVSLAHCADKLRARGVENRNLARRAATLETARARRGLARRDLDSLDTSHDMSDLGYTENTSISKLFSSNGSCVLTPEVTQGPYCE